MAFRRVATLSQSLRKVTTYLAGTSATQFSDGNREGLVIFGLIGDIFVSDCRREFYQIGFVPTSQFAT